MPGETRGEPFSHTAVESKRFMGNLLGHSFRDTARYVVVLFAASIVGAWHAELLSVWCARSWNSMLVTLIFTSCTAVHDL